MLTANAAWNILNFRRPLVEALLQDGNIVSVFAPSDTSVPALKSLGCHFIPLEMDAKGLNPVGGPQLLLQYYRRLRVDRPDVILSYTIKNNIFGAMAASWLDIPFVPNITGLGTAILSRGRLRSIAEILYRLCFRRSHVVFFQNEEDLGYFTERRLVRQKQTRLLPGSGIDLVHFMPTHSRLPMDQRYS